MCQFSDLLVCDQSLESISKELVAKLQARLAHWEVNTTQIGDVLVQMVSVLKITI